MDALEYASGVAQGINASLSFGLIGAPRASDSTASLSGQLTASLAITHISATVLGASGTAAGGGLIAAPESGGTSLAVEPVAGAAALVSLATAAGGAKNSAAVLAMAITKPGTGRGSVPSDQRDKKRLFTKKETEQMLKNQEGTCAMCEKPKVPGEVDGHHIVRHADGGATNPDTNGAALCNGPGGCHEQIHKP